MIPWYWKAGGLALVLAGVIATFVAWRAYVFHEGELAERKVWEAKELQQKLDATTADLAASQAEIEDLKARDVAAAALQVKLEKEKAHAKAAADRTIADLRAGALRLRQQFTCPAPQAAEATAGGDVPEARGGLRQQDAEFLVRESERADAVVHELNACVDQLHADRGDPAQ